MSYDDNNILILAREIRVQTIANLTQKMLPTNSPFPQEKDIRLASEVAAKIYEHAYTASISRV